VGQLQVVQPTAIQCMGAPKRATRHICGPATSGPANSNTIYGLSKCASRHICRPAMSGPANRDTILAMPSVPAKTYDVVPRGPVMDQMLHKAGRSSVTHIIFLAGTLGSQNCIPVGWTTHSGPAYMSAGTLGEPIYCIAVGWTTCSWPTYMSGGTLGAPIHCIAVGWTTCSWPTYICQLAHLECPYILSLSAGPLVVGMHICWLARLECPYILSLLAGLLIVGPHIC